MLTGLYINHLAVIEQAYIEFTKGLNVFTGETGAGKSIVIDAINSVLGQRVSKEIVRTGEKKAVVSAVFGDLSDKVLQKLSELGLEAENGELIIQREITADGKSSARVCARPVTASALRELGGLLMNIHGQHDNQILMTPERHIDLLDNYGELSAPLAAYQEEYQKLLSLRRELDRLNMDEAQKAQKMDLLRYQVNEIEAAQLQEGEEEELESRKKAVSNASKIMESLGEAYQCFYGSQESDGAVDLVNSASGALSYASGFYEDLKDASDRMADISIELQEIASQVGDSFQGLDFDPRELDDIESRLDELYRLKRKYGPTVQDVIVFGEQAREELDKMEGADEEIARLQTRLACSQEHVTALAEELSSLRQQAARRFVDSVREEVKFLDMPGVKLGVRFERIPAYDKGIDKLEFLISTNPGEPPKPIAKIASGGELSRIMLAIKNTLADKDEIPTLIFDEIDTGVSGRAAQKIGLKLSQAAKNRQILCVTHSAQIAALSDTHFLIAKSVEGDRTFTRVTQLDFDGRKQELARIMGTDQITDLMLQNAEEMLRAGQKSEN